LSEAAERAAVDLARGERPEDAWVEEARVLSGALEQVTSGGAPRRPDANRATASRPSAAAGSGRSATCSEQPKATAVAEDPGLLGRVASAVAHCRQARCAVSLGLLEVDDYDSFILNLGPDRAAHLVHILAAAIDSLSETTDRCVQTGDACFGLTLRDCERQQGVESMKRLARGIRQWSEGRPETGGRGITFSIGLATLSLPPKNFPGEELIEAAERCLYGARSAGGDGVKSIHI
jgi:GGDEF domain-containing protein